MTTAVEAIPDEKRWRFSINYGPEGETNYANVYDDKGQLVGNLRTHHASLIVEGMNSDRTRNAPDGGEVEPDWKRGVLVKEVPESEKPYHGPVKPRAASPASGVGVAWNPIATADKDAPSLMLGIFRKGALEEIHIGGYRHALNDDEISCWWSDQASDEICPTHWLPLPGSSSALVESPEQGEVVRELVAELVRAIRKALRKAFQCPWR